MLRSQIMSVFMFVVFFNAFTSTVHSSKIPSAVLDLNEKFLDVMDNGYWFVKFYAPWCAHCKRLAPVWEHMAHALADVNSEVRVGKMDCTRFPSVASTLGISGYPSIIFFRKGVRIPYEGERKKKNMFEFAEKSAGPVVQELTSLVRFYELRQASAVDPFFVYVRNADAPISIQTRVEEEVDDDGEILSPPPTPHDLFNSIAETFFTDVRFFTVNKSIIGNAKSVEIPPAEALGTDSVFVVKDRRQVFFDMSQPIDNLRGWIESERWPLIPQITTSNVYAVATSAQKKLVLIVGDPTEMISRLNVSTPTGRFFTTFKKAANLSYYDDPLRAAFQYGWTDEVAMVRSVVMCELALPNLVVLNLTSYEFYLSDDHPEQITEFSLQTLLHRIVAANVTADGGRSWSMRFRRMVYEVTTNIHDMLYHQPILTVCLFGVPLAFFSIIFYSICSADFSIDRNEIYPDNEDYDDQPHDAVVGDDEPNEENLNDDGCRSNTTEDEKDDRESAADSDIELIQSAKHSAQKKSD